MNKYLQTSQPRQKWQVHGVNVSNDDLVLIKEPKLPQTWKTSLPGKLYSSS